MKYAYFPGCVAEDSCKELDNSTRLVADKLGMELVKIEDATCCGAGYMQEYSGEMSLFLNARTFALADKTGAETVMTICSSCQLHLSEANNALKDDEKLLKRMNDRLDKIGLHYSGNLKVKHLLQILIEDYGMDNLSAKKVSSLGMKVAPFYGCHLLRPPEAHKFDDAENPKSLDTVITALGAEPVDYNGKTKCCGFHLLMVKEDIPLKMSGKHLSEAKAKGADCVVTPCPLCHLVLDAYQPSIEKKTGKKLGVPILHLSQMVGLSLGIEPSKLGFNRHIASMKNVSRKNIVSQKVSGSAAVAEASKIFNADAKETAEKISSSAKGD